MGRRKTRFNEINLKIGNRIKEERLKLSPKMSRQKLLKNVFNTEGNGNTLLYWENGRNTVPSEELKKLAAYFNVRLEYLSAQDDFRTMGDFEKTIIDEIAYLKNELNITETAAIKCVMNFNNLKLDSMPFIQNEFKIDIIFDEVLRSIYNESHMDHSINYETLKEIETKSKFEFKHKICSESDLKQYLKDKFSQEIKARKEMFRQIKLKHLNYKLINNIPLSKTELNFYETIQQHPFFQEVINEIKRRKNK